MMHGSGVVPGGARAATLALLLEKRPMASLDNPTARADIVNRLKRAEGQLRGVQRMVEDDAYCIDILKQTQAIQRALEKFNSLILANHLNGCVTTALRGEQPDERERVVHELLQVFDATARL